jgi:hypothetical protein
MDDRPGPAERRYHRPYVLPDRLESLSGAVSGTVYLPRHLDWSGRAVYDLDAPGRLIDLYRTVLIEAARPQDLERFLDAAALRRLWSYLWLPVALRAAWEARFTDLAQLGRAAAA